MSASAVWPNDADFDEKDTDEGSWQPQNFLRDCKYVCDSYKVIKTPEQKIFVPKLLTHNDVDGFRWECAMKLLKARVLNTFSAPYPPLHPLPDGITAVIRHNFFDRSISCEYTTDSYAPTVLGLLNAAGLNNWGFGWAMDRYNPSFHLRSSFSEATVAELAAVDPYEEKRTGKTDKNTVLWRQLFNPDLPFPGEEVELIRKRMEEVLACRVIMSWEDSRLPCRHCGQLRHPWEIVDQEPYCSLRCMPLGARQRFYEDKASPALIKAARERGEIL